MRATLDDVQRIIRGLRPIVLDEMGLGAALTRLRTEALNSQGLAVDLHIRGLAQDERLEASIETALYRIIQEALANVVRHSGASNASVILEKSSEEITLIVEDDGHGFDTESAAASGRFGLKSMHERADLLGGSFVLESSRGEGTTIYVKIPLAS